MPIKSYILALFWSVLLPPVLTAQSPFDYRDYHQKVIQAEQYIAEKAFTAAIEVYDSLFQVYPFIFIREYQVATQLAAYTGDQDRAYQYLEKGIQAGWLIKHVKKQAALKSLRQGAEWDRIQSQAKTWKQQREQQLDPLLVKQVKKMYKKDQRKAFRALFRFTSKGQDRYAERVFAPHSERQIAELKSILTNKGYPGYRLVGNDYWMSTVISHHNSISTNYNVQDTLYAEIKPMLFAALQRGQISPFELALIDEWYRSTTHKEIRYGILDGPTRDQLTEVNTLRAQVGMRSVELRNQLVDIEKETGLNLYLNGGPWIDGAIEIR